MHVFLISKFFNFCSSIVILIDGKKDGSFHGSQVDQAYDLQGQISGGGGRPSHRHPRWRRRGGEERHLGRGM